MEKLKARPMYSLQGVTLFYFTDNMTTLFAGLKFVNC
jgi:hypothetical protein